MTLLFEPFAPLFELSRELNRLAPGGMQVRSFVPAADVVATDEDVTVVMDVPGLEADDLEIELVDDVLTVRGERGFPYGGGQSDQRVWQRLERGFGRFERVLHVPQGLAADSIRAEMADGVLTLHIPGPVTRRPHRIEIASGGQQALEQTASEEREMAGAAT
jgi:HSP20 family protein